MAISSDRSRQKKAARKSNESRAALEQKALEGRAHELLRYLKKNNVEAMNDLTFLRLSWLWLYCDPKKELVIDEFMNLTESEIHERFDNLKSKGHLQKLISFEKVIELYGIEDNEVAVPYRYAV